ncbi:hypothetical protein B5M09_006382 [Aphanomyces astaci]|uniref:EF-hand domain-containing protein n=1 Tax=Aphanomyces astaci TaxID=112090 RepID=A0A3R7YNM0_APHAT|nr:hypothetical protein B5M09_006382 [Aphanomyces astaci]
MTFSSVTHDAPPVEGTKAPSSSIKPQQVLAAVVQDADTVASSGTLRDDHASTPPMGETRPNPVRVDVPSETAAIGTDTLVQDNSIAQSKSNHDQTLHEGKLVLVDDLSTSHDELRRIPQCESSSSDSSTEAKADFNDTPDHIADSDDQPSPKLHKSESKCTIEQSDMTLTRSPSIFRMLETTPTVGDTPPSQPPSIPPDVAHKVVQHIIFRWMKSAVPLRRLFPPSPSASSHPLDTFLSTLQQANVALKPVEVSALRTSFPPTPEPPLTSAPCLNVTLLVDSVATKLFPIELLEFQLRKAVVAKATKTRGKCDVFKALNQLFDTPTTTDTSMSPRVHFVHCLDRFVRNVQFDTLSVEGVFRSLVQDTDFERGFRAIDADGSGSLSLAECTKYLQTSHQVAFPPAVLQDFLRRFDRDGDGSLNLDEFMACSRTETGISKQLKCEIPKKKAIPPAVQFPIDVSTWTRMDVKKWLIYNVQVKTLAHKFAAVDGHMLLGWAVHPHLDVWLRDKYSIAQPVLRLRLASHIRQLQPQTHPSTTNRGNVNDDSGDDTVDEKLDEDNTTIQPESSHQNTPNGLAIHKPELIRDSRGCQSALLPLPTDSQIQGENGTSDVQDTIRGNGDDDDEVSINTEDALDSITGDECLPGFSDCHVIDPGDDDNHPPPPFDDPLPGFDD